MGQHHHHHGHQHDGHGHHHGQGANERVIGAAALLTGGFMVAEVTGGLVSGSLALLADAGHMLTDAASLVLAWMAFRLARRPADGKRTYGFDRFSVLAAFVNGIALFGIAIWVMIEAIMRFAEPVSILGGLMFWIAVAGLIVNVLSFWILTRGESENLNIRAAALHVMGDLLGSVAAIVASVIVMWTGWTPIDPILSIFVSWLVLRSAWHVVRESGHILLEGSPSNFDTQAVAADLVANIPEVERVHHVHAWSITQERPMVTMEATVRPRADLMEVKRALKHRVYEEFGVEHVTVELTELDDAEHRSFR